MIMKMKRVAIIITRKMKEVAIIMKMKRVAIIITREVKER